MYERIKTLDKALMDFWSPKPRFVWYHPGGSGMYPTGEPCGLDARGRALFKSTWDGSHYSLKQWSRIDFCRPADDWENADWDKVARNCRGLSQSLLLNSRASERASWMECLVGAVYHVCTQGHYLQDSRLCVEGAADAFATRQQLIEIWTCLTALGIPMPPEVETNTLPIETLPEDYRH